MTDLTDKTKYCRENSNSNLPAPHRYTIPVEWSYLTDEFGLGNGTCVPVAIAKRVTKLMCKCGRERQRG